MTLLYRAARDIVRVAFKIVGRTTVVGYENIPPTGGVIVACNHVSYLDPPLVGSTILRECAFMARHDLWNRPMMGKLISRLNAFPVRRDTADRGAIKEAIGILERGLVLVLFPEGTRSPDGLLQQPQPGLALIVQKSGVPVIPAAVIGPERMLPAGSNRLRMTRLVVAFGPPATFGPGATRDEVLDTVMDRIADLLRVHRPHMGTGRESRSSVG